MTSELDDLEGVSQVIFAVLVSTRVIVRQVIFAVLVSVHVRSSLPSW